MGFERAGNAASWLTEALVAPHVQGHGLPPPQEEALSESFLKPLVFGDQKASLASLSL